MRHFSAACRDSAGPADGVGPKRPPTTTPSVSLAGVTSSGPRALRAPSPARSRGPASRPQRDTLGAGRPRIDGAGSPRAKWVERAFGCCGDSEERCPGWWESCGRGTLRQLGTWRTGRRARPLATLPWRRVVAHCSVNSIPGLGRPGHFPRGWVLRSCTGLIMQSSIRSFVALFACTSYLPFGALIHEALCVCRHTVPLEPCVRNTHIHVTMMHALSKGRLSSHQCPPHIAHHSSESSMWMLPERLARCLSRSRRCRQSSTPRCTTSRRARCLAWRKLDQQ